MGVLEHGSVLLAVLSHSVLDSTRSFLYLPCPTRFDPIVQSTHFNSQSLKTFGRLLDF